MASAPKPLTLIKTPCPSAPTFRMLTANTGIIKMYAIPKKLLKNVMLIRNENTELLLMNASPSSISRTGLPLPPRGMGGSVSAAITSAIATKPDPAMKNEVGTPSVAMTMPAAAGATMRVPCHIAAFKDTALIIALRSMRCG